MQKELTGKDLAAKIEQRPGEVQSLELSGLQANSLHKLSLLKALVRLRITESRVLKATLSQVFQLRSVVLTKCQLVSCKVIDLPELTGLVLSHNILNTLEVKGCSKLGTLVVDHNQLSFLRDLPSSLQTLILSSNKMNGLDGVPIIKKLRKLSLSNNEIASLQGIQHFTGLRELRLNRNRLQLLPPQLVKLTKLQLLDIGNNQIASPPQFQQQMRVSNLTVRGNLILDQDFLAAFSRVSHFNNKRFVEKQKPVKEVKELKPVLEPQHLMLVQQQHEARVVFTQDNRVLKNKAIHAQGLADLQQRALRLMLK